MPGVSPHGYHGLVAVEQLKRIVIREQAFVKRHGGQVRIVTIGEKEECARSLVFHKGPFMNGTYRDLEEGEEVIRPVSDCVVLECEVAFVDKAQEHILILFFETLKAQVVQAEDRHRLLCHEPRYVAQFFNVPP